MTWANLITSDSHTRILNYLADPEHDTYGPPTIEMIAAELETDAKSAANLVRPLLAAGMILAEPGPFEDDTRYMRAEVLGEIS